MAAHTILIIDDEVEIAQLVNIHLQNVGFNTLLAYDGQEGLETFHNNKVDLIILDSMMPNLNGNEFLKELRKTDQTPVIFLSAKTSDFDKISGLVIGADDYMTKPFNPMELIARVNAQLRRAFQWRDKDGQNKDDTIRIQDVIIRKSDHAVLVDGERIELTPKEFDIFYLLASSPKHVFSTEQIFKNVWQEDYFDSSNTVMVHIRTLRKKIKEPQRTRKLIDTVWGVGYRINE